MASDSVVSVCVVLRNDAAKVEAFVRAMIHLLSTHYQFYELIIVDNHSSDSTSQRVQTLQKELPGIRLIRLSRIYDFEMAMTAALDNSVGDWVVVMNPFYDPLELIPQMVAKGIEGNDIVIVRRKNKSDYSFVDRWLGALFYRIANRVLHHEFHMDDTDFRAFSRLAVNSVTQIRRKRRSLKYFNQQVGLKHGYIHDKEMLDMPRFNRFEAVMRAFDLILSNSATPLRLATLMGLLASFLNMLYFVYIIVVTLIKDRIVEGWITTSVMSTTMFFLLFLILTILTEYVARLLDESRDEPLYFVEYEKNSLVSSYDQVMNQNEINVV